MYGCVALDRESVAKTPYKRRSCTDICNAIGADIFEIQPEVPYTKADLNWMDKKSRSTIEMSDPASVPSRFMRKIVCRLRLNEVSRQ